MSFEDIIHARLCLFSCVYLSHCFDFCFVQIDAHSVELNLNRETLATIINSFSSVFPAQEEDLDPESPDFDVTSGFAQLLEQSTLFEDVNDTHDEQKTSFHLVCKLDELSATLIRQGEAVAECSAKNMACTMALAKHGITLDGKVGDVRVKDPTPAGAFYPVVFATEGDEMLTFRLASSPSVSEGDLFKNGNICFVDEASRLRSREHAAPDLSYAASLTVKMGRVRYLHTRRFLTVVSNFALQLQHTQQMLAQMRRVAKGMVEQIQRLSFKSLLLLDVQIDSPVVVVPRNSLSDQLMEANLGKTLIRNAIRIDASPYAYADGVSVDVNDSIHAVLERITVQVSDMSLCSGNAVSFQTAGAGHRAADALRTSNLDDLDDSSSECWSDQNDVTPHVQPGESVWGRVNILSDCSLLVHFERNLTLQRRDHPNLLLDVHVKDVNVQVDTPPFCVLYFLFLFCVLFCACPSFAIIYLLFC